MSGGVFVAKQQETGQQSFDKPIWLLISILLIGALYANQQFQHIAWALRLTAWLVFACALIGLTLLTAKGQSWKIFFNEARLEMRKVVWPTRQTVGQMTLVVMVMVLIASLLMWIMDTVFVKVIQLLTVG